MSIDFMVYTPPASSGGVWRYREDLPSLNVANGTGYAVLRAIGFTDPGPGDLIEDPACIADLRRRVGELLAAPQGLDPWTRPATVEPAQPALSVIDAAGERLVRPGRCAVIDCGLSAERLKCVLERLEEVLSAADEERLAFGWG